MSFQAQARCPLRAETWRNMVEHGGTRLWRDRGGLSGPPLGPFGLGLGQGRRLRVSVPFWMCWQPLETAHGRANGAMRPRGWAAEDEDGHFSHLFSIFSSFPHHVHAFRTIFEALASVSKAVAAQDRPHGLRVPLWHERHRPRQLHGPGDLARRAHDAQDAHRLEGHREG